MVTVVIPTHNREDLIGRAIESVQKQTYSDLEIIVVADGSTDETDKIVKGLQEKDDRIKYFSYSPSRGGNFARNYGINKAKGEYVAFLDDDDEWYIDKLEKQLEVMKRDEEIGLVYTGVNIIYVNEKVEYSSIPKEEGDLQKRIFLKNWIGTTSTILAKKEIINKAGAFDEKLPALQDYDLWIRICQHTKIGAVKEKLINYYNYRNSSQVSSSTEKYIDAFSIINKKYAKELDALSAEELKMKEKNEVLLLINKALRNNNPKLARKYIKQGLAKGFDKKYVINYVFSFWGYDMALSARKFLS